MKPKTLSAFAAFALLAASAVGAAAQAQEVWRSITNNGDDFAAAIPPDMIVINEDRGFPRLILSSQDVRLEISVRPNTGAKDAAIYAAGSQSPDIKEAVFESNGVYGTVRVSDRPLRSATLIHASSTKHIYSVAAYARRNDHPKVLRFLASLRFGGKPAMAIMGFEPEIAGNATEIDDLESSEIVREFLKKPTNKKVEVRFGPIDPGIPMAFSPGGVPPQTDPNETRSLIFLRMPKPAYRPAGGRISGTVTVQVTLLSNGQVGSIVADPTLDSGLARAATEAAKNIKFIPATILGKPVDVTRTFTYNFMAR